ncbi:piggyBac transposable element-derived protein 4-like [Macrobrachium nipponense]|uniref:piggyBac transposable element-derived protein 4-like n=1 Tax=Macrobrachium nipponense TaxID=159736 RepID=UPI0030C864C5
MARQGRNLSDFQILELLDASDNESEIDCIEAEVLYDSDLDKEYVPSHQEMIESSDSDSEEDLPRRRIETKAAGQKRKRPRHLPSTISPDNIATPSTGLATSTPGPSGYSVPLAIGDSDPHSSTAAPAAIPATAPAGTPATTPASPAATLPAVPAPTPATAPAAPRGQRRRRADDGELLVTFNSATVKSNSGYTWHTRPQVAAARRTPARNIVVSSRPGPTQAASQYTTPEECFDLFMSTAIVDLIVDFTNKKIDDVATKYKRKTATVQHTTAAEIRALLGVLIFSGYRKDNHLNTRELWCSEVGALFYKAAMSEVRFNFLLYCLRFDDMGTREQRRATDKFAPVREMWDMFMANCEDNYTPHENLTVDEQLLAFRGKCPFRMYIPNKPAKYGIKIVMVNDVQSKYLLKAIPYLGKAGTTTRHGLTLGHMFTKDLTSRYQNTNRNVTTDNWFTSVPLIQDLLTNGLTLVGTVRANKPEIPPVMREKKDRRPGSSAFLFTDDLTLVSYVPNTQTTKKNVLLLSSMHTQQVVNDVTGKPNIIEYYNETKGGVDTFDQMCATYNCSRKTNRWPLCVFFGMVNASIINSWIIYKANNPTLQRKELHRRKFMHGLALQLIKPSAQERMNNPSQHRQVKLAIRQVCSLNLRSGTAAGAGPSAAEMRNPMVRCTKCDSKADKKTRFRCHSCRQPVCPSHYFPYCCDCI